MYGIRLIGFVQKIVEMYLLFALEKVTDLKYTSLWQKLIGNEESCYKGLCISMFVAFKGTY